MCPSMLRPLFPINSQGSLPIDTPSTVDFFNIPIPVTPSDMPTLDQDSLVLSMVAESFEENSAGKQGDLDGLDIHIHAILPP